MSFAVILFRERLIAPKTARIILHRTGVVRARAVLNNSASSSRSKSLDSKIWYHKSSVYRPSREKDQRKIWIVLTLALLHFGFIIIFDNGDRLAAMDFVPVNRMSVQV